MEIFLKLVIAILAGYILFSRYLKRKPRKTAEVSVDEEVMHDRFVSNEAMIEITEQTLKRAFELQLQALALASPSYYNAACLEQIRDNWPHDRLMQKCGEALFNGQVLSLRSWSGYGGVGHPDAHYVDLSPDADNESIGFAVKEVLERSWELTLRDLTAEVRSRDRDELNGIYQEWLNGFLLRHGYKTKKALFKNMLHCTMLCRSGVLTISPSNHDQLDGWSGKGLPANSDVIIPMNSSIVSIGAALRLAFSRCLDTYGEKKS